MELLAALLSPSFLVGTFTPLLVALVLIALLVLVVLILSPYYPFVRSLLKFLAHSRLRRLV